MSENQTGSLNVRTWPGGTMMSKGWTNVLHSQNNTPRVSFAVKAVGLRAINTKGENKNGSDR